MHTHYDNLKVARTAPHAVVKAAYRALSQQYHPDRNGHSDAARIMRILNDAWAVLGDADKRAAYDSQLAAKERRARIMAEQAAQRPEVRPQTDPADNAKPAPDQNRPPRASNNSQPGKSVGMKLYVFGCVLFFVVAAFCLQAIIYLAG